MRDGEPERAVSTGVPGLDYILRGGLPSNHLYLIEGDPGTGKTTLALQFLLEGLRAGEKGLYVTLSETKSELLTVAASHGWSVDGIGIFELASLEQRLQAAEQYTVFHPSEVELSETSKRICEEVERIQPTRVVFDSLSEMRLLAREPLRYRRQVLALKQFFAGRQCTVILLDDRTSQDTDLQLQSISHGVILMERMAVEYGGARRRLIVAKMRGLQFREGHHDFSIQPGGLVVYPRLVAAEKRASENGRPATPREEAKSGIATLDALVGGGIHYGTSTLVLGPAGSGKSTLLTQYALSAGASAVNGWPVTFLKKRERISSSEPRGWAWTCTIKWKTARCPWSRSIPRKCRRANSCTRCGRQWMPNREPARARVVVIDSLNGYLNAMPSENFLLIQMHELLTYLNEQGVLTLMVLAQHGLVGAAMQTPVDVTYLADTVIVLRYFEAFGEVKQALAVVKKRTGGHERSIREFQNFVRRASKSAPLSRILKEC